MAREAGFMLRAESVKGQSDWWECFDEAIEKLVALVRADERDKWMERTAILIRGEREACAKVCEDIYNDPKDNNGYDCYYTRPYLECADAIRARGQA
jgi:hypothetical protein